MIKVTGLDKHSSDYLTSKSVVFTRDMKACPRQGEMISTVEGNWIVVKVFHNLKWDEHTVEVWLTLYERF